MRARGALVLVLGLFAWADAGRADVFHLDDGGALEGARVGQDRGELLVQTASGLERVPLARVARVEVAPVDADVARRAERVRERLLERQGREVGRLLRRYARADAAERAELVAALEGYEPAARVDPLEDALDDRRAEVRAFALERLSGLGEGVDALVRAALTTGHDDVREPAHEAALALDAGRVRAIYEAVSAAPTKPLRRYKALHFLGLMRDPAAVPKLVYALERIRNELRTAQATAGGLRQQPVDLGTGQAAGTSVPVELPEAQLTQINTVTEVVALRQLSGKAADVLRRITGEDLGEDPDAWRRWLEEQERRQRQPR